MASPSTQRSSCQKWPHCSLPLPQVGSSGTCMCAPALLGPPPGFTFPRPCLTLGHWRTCLLECRPEKQNSPSEGRHTPIGITQGKSCAPPTTPPWAPCKQPSKTRGLSHKTKSNCVSTCPTTTAVSSPSRAVGNGKASPGDMELEQSCSHLWDASNPTRNEQPWHETQGCCTGLGANGRRTRNSGWSTAEGRMESFSQPGCSSR